jgi:outer membrane protein assembly factor BamE (lipoprotein component of BamABCDE complex)
MWGLLVSNVLYATHSLTLAFDQEEETTTTDNQQGADAKNFESNSTKETTGKEGTKKQRHG